jgi:hypothetical protein
LHPRLEAELEAGVLLERRGGRGHEGVLPRIEPARRLKRLPGPLRDHLLQARQGPCPGFAPRRQVGAPLRPHLALQGGRLIGGLGLHFGGLFGGTRLDGGGCHRTRYRHTAGYGRGKK